MTVGVLELCHLPKLEIFNLEARIDTGAQTSSLHVDNIEEFEKDGKLYIRYDIHPDVHDVSKIVARKSLVKSIRSIKSSNGQKENRYVIDTDMVIGAMEWEIEVTLTDRSNMSYLMLVGREAMVGRLVVDPELNFNQPLIKASS
ncbi:RimK/LysX family protein [Alteromonadaceae bacterium BrNp21-10]|nr:RimK/LysX family protein [Alteromonadaceae bacterium BrNp21-10]